VRVRYFICNTPPAYAVISVLHRPVESAADSVSTLPRQEADSRRGGAAGQGQLSV